MPDGFQIRSHIGLYDVHFIENGFEHAGQRAAGDQAHFIVDGHVADLYRKELSAVLSAPSVLLIDANENSKSLEQMTGYVGHLVEHGIRRDHQLIAIGGGVTQDITCFLAATMLRGVDWLFYPTTLLAQADSCIGSKSSINVGNAKNIMGTFTPPREVFIDVNVTKTLAEHDVRSGVGEILKVHAISGPDEFQRLAADYSRLFYDRDVLERYIRNALLIKKPYVESDEYDLNERQIFNYGHSFGHAIESATHFAVPHGIAVTMGMDMANFVSAKLGKANDKLFRTMHPTLAANYRNYENCAVPGDLLFAALGKDKKNSGQGAVTVILPDSAGKLARYRVPADEAFRSACLEFLTVQRSI